MAILSMFQQVKKPDYPVHPVANTNSVKFTKEYMSLYQRRYNQQNKDRIKANYLTNSHDSFGISVNTIGRTKRLYF